MRWFTKPGLGRCLWMIPLFFGIGVGIMALVRWLEGWDPVWLGEVVVTVSLVTIPMGFLAGIGSFDYWARYAIGQPTEPRTTPATAQGAGATTSGSTPTTR